MVFSMTFAAAAAARRGCQKKMMMMKSELSAASKKNYTYYDRDHHHDLPFLSLIALLLFLITIGSIELVWAAAEDDTVPDYLGTPAMAKLSTCYIYPADQSDIGFIFSANQARLQAHSRMHDLYPNVTISSPYFPHFTSEKNKTKALEDFIVEHDCDLIISISFTNLFDVDMNYILAKFPNVIFHANDAAKINSTASRPANYRHYGSRMDEPWMVAGAVAGAQTRTCIGFFYAIDRNRGSVNAFVEGVRKFTKNKYPIYIIKLGSFFNPEAEKILGELFLKKGCDVVAHWSNSKELETSVAAIRPLNHTVFSVGYSADIAHYMGDTVLTSVMFKSKMTFFDMMNSTLFALPPEDHLQTYANGQLGISQVSPRARSEANIAWHEANKVVREGFEASCKPITDQDGFIHNNEGRCLTLNERLGTDYLTSNAQNLGTYQSFKAQCAAGTYYAYSSVNFTLSCMPCPANTFSLEPVSATCTPCPENTRSDPGSTSCKAETAVLSSGLIALVTILVALFVAAIIGVAVVLHRNQVSNYNRNLALAPQGPNVTLAMLGIDNALSEPHWRRSLDMMCTVYDILASAVEKAANDHHVYIHLAVGDVFQLAAPDAKVMSACLRDIHTRMKNAQWPCRIILRIAYFNCEPIITKAEGRTRYSGSDASALGTLWRGSLADCDATLACVEDPTGTLQGVGRVGQAAALLIDGQNVTSYPVFFNINSLLTLDPISGGAEQKSSDSMSETESKPSSSLGGRDEDTIFHHVTLVTHAEFQLFQSLCSDFLMAFLRTLPFELQMEALGRSASKLHIPAPKVPAMTTHMKRAHNVLMGPSRQLSSQLLILMEERELLYFVHSFADQAKRREALEGHPGATLDTSPLGGGTTDLDGVRAVIHHQQTPSSSNNSHIRDEARPEIQQQNGKDHVGQDPPSPPTGSSPVTKNPMIVGPHE